MDTRERTGAADERGDSPESALRNDPPEPELPLALRVGRRVNRAYHRRLGRRTHDPRGVDVVAADWDLLVVLDACRPDAFEQVVRQSDAFERTGGHPGRAERRRSRGSHTVEFLWGNFGGRELHETVYVTANVQPYVYRGALDFHHVEHAWVDGFDDEVGTVPPGAVTDAALEAAERFPRKRLVAHYLQPHYPFLDGPDFAYGTMDFWDAVAAGEVDAGRDRLRAYHEANLRRVLPAVDRLLGEFEGRAVVTADHGTALGERVRPAPVREWGHPWGVYADPLVEVPWVVREVGGERREVVAEAPVEMRTHDEAVVQERLDALGYA